MSTLSSLPSINLDYLGYQRDSPRPSCTSTLRDRYQKSSKSPTPSTMPVPVRLRLARHGHRHNPIFHLVAINSAKPRNAQPIETLGQFDPIPRVASTSALPQSSQVFGEKKSAPVPKEKKVEWDVGRINYWLGVGAQPTKSVVKLLERVSYISSEFGTKLIMIGRSIDDTTSMATSIFTCPFISFLSFYQNTSTIFDE
jgi:small subunit ribosomal protein S16